MSVALEARPDIDLTPVGWSPQGEIDFDEWRETGRKLGQISRATQWWIGDWLNFGANAYGEKYVEAVEVTGYDVQTLMNFAYVAGRIEISRRREILSWGHHADVAALEPAKQDRILEQAAKDGWSVARLRTELRGPKSNGHAPAGLEVRLAFKGSFSNEQLRRQAVGMLREKAEELGFAVIAT